MAVYRLINKVAVPFFSFSTIIPPPTDGPIPQATIGDNQSFQLNVFGDPGAAVSATVQVYVSNDRVVWTQYLDPLTAAGTGSASNGYGGSQPWEYFSAWLTAISGTNAKATLLMNG